MKEILELTEREMATIAAALYVWGDQDSEWRDAHDVATDAGKFKALDRREIERLRERMLRW